ncbi:alpha/beta hydrolase [Adhaeretor mobilis]|uniref:Carboxylesterase NlhH n=1 Tax=Adhaeretor mobilis TaxID=1930276 RepID=A0A517MR22_9BACT|nr:alpha/beta hydrolase [Adhaeretor mobilis]QDS97336.1 Carboxylesterase NlhH [Adhaeretor mobilis]
MHRVIPLFFALLFFFVADISAAIDATEATPKVPKPEITVKYGQTYVERESGPLKADVYMPATPGPHPGVIVVHGGAWYMGTRAQLTGIAQRLAREGFTAVAISYRFAPKHKFPAQIEDCKAAVRWMREQAETWKIDPNRIGGFGYSAGAQLVTLLGTSDAADGLEDPAADNSVSTRLQAVAGGGTPSDFRLIPLDNSWLAFWLGGTRRDQPEQYRRASPVVYASEDDPPMFLFHGENDQLVPLDSAQHLVDSLTNVGVPAEIYVAPKLGHNVTVFDRESLNKSLAFLKKELRPGALPAQATP